MDFLRELRLVFVFIGCTRLAGSDYPMDTKFLTLSIETVVNLISNTTTRTGLKVRCDIDNNEYLKGTKITDGELVRSHLILFWSLVLELHHSWFQACRRLTSYFLTIPYA